MPYSPVDRPFSWKHLIDTDQVVAIPCFFHTLTINRPDVGAGALITIYDVATAADIDAAHMLANITMDDAFFVIPTTLFFDVGLSHGLYVLFSAGMTTGDITISYK